jgi:hypothetical protein
MSETESQTEDVQYKVTKDFRNHVLKWVEIDDHIRTLRAKVKEFNDMKKDYETNIITYLTKVDEESIVIKDGKISKNVSKSKAPLKKETIHKSLVELIGDSNKAMAMTDHIINSRPTVERVRLSRTKNREKKN